ncbi:hypothetical protein AAHH17_14000 [Lysinibacillus capsici]|uniref:hypothetical protein n=1 Tax=Lysinibacillus capsici TaxID=2115968 RepID=UPI0032E4FC19
MLESSSKTDFQICSSNDLHKIPIETKKYLLEETGRKPFANFINNGKKYQVDANTLIASITDTEHDSITSSKTFIKGNHNKSIEGGLSMNDREYVDAKVNALEANMNQKILAQSELFTEKLKHIETKIDSNQSIIMAKLDTLTNSVMQQNEIIKRDIEIVTSQKIDELKTELGNKQKETKSYMWMIAGVVAGVATLAVTVIQMFIK